MLRKIVVTSLMIFSLGLSSVSIASDLKYPMRDLNKSYQAFKKSKNAEDGLNALNAMHKAVLASQEKLPNKLNKLDQGQPEVKAYRESLQLLVEKIDEAKALIEANQFEQAKHLIDDIDQIKKQGHENYK